MLAPLLHHVPGPNLSPPDHSAGLLDLMLPMLRFAGKWCHHMGVGVRKQAQPVHMRRLLWALVPCIRVS